MNPALVSFPGSRELSGLCRQLASRATQPLWIAHLFLHHVEAPVWVRQTTSLDPLSAAALRAFEAVGACAASTVESMLGLGPAVTRRLLHDLATAQLIEPAAAHSWRASRAGRRAIGSQSSHQRALQRRDFHFVDALASDSPRFLPLAHAAGQPFVAPADWSFHPDVLRACISGPLEWKQRHGFPVDVEALLAPSDAAESAEPIPDWQHVILDRAETLTVAVSLTGEAYEGLVLEPASWTLSHSQPVFQLGTNAAREILGNELGDPSPADWRSAWVAWCASQGLSPPEANSCRFTLEAAGMQLTGHSLRPERLRPLLQELQAGVWLLVGGGMVRRVLAVTVATEALARPAESSERRPPPRPPHQRR
jgi:hypothetical protein